MVQLQQMLMGMTHMLQSRWYLGLVGLVLLVFGIMRLGFLKGLLTVGVGLMLVLNSWYWAFEARNTSDYGFFVSLALLVVGAGLFLYALVFADAK